MDKSVMISILYEYYKKLLTEKQAESIYLYYFEDLSLTEIAEIQGVSKQSISETIKRSEKFLLDCEESLGIYKRFNELSDMIEQLEANLLNDLDNETFSKYLDLLFRMKEKLR